MKQILCINCSKNEAQKVEPYGYIFCKPCIARQKKYKVGEAIELTTDEIREDRKKYSTDIVQRYRGDTANKKYIKKYGTKGFTEEQVKNAKDVYPDYYKDE